MRNRIAATTALLLVLSSPFILRCAEERPAFPSGVSDNAYKAANGPYAVETMEEIVLHDARRDEDLSLRVSFPKGDGLFPVIVFSHGAGGSGRYAAPLTRFWTTHGYVCISPSHDDSIALRRKRGEGIRNIVGDAINDSKGWKNRAKDVSFVLDSLDEIEVKVPALKGRMDHSRVGVGGHSYGAYTAQLIGGARINLPGKLEMQSFADDRPKAILMLSGQGTGQQGLTKSSWDRFTRPLLNVTGSLDRGAGGQGPEWKREPFQYCPPGDKYHLCLEGAHHGSFTGQFTSESDAGSRLAGAGAMRAQLREAIAARLRKASPGEPAGSKDGQSLSENQDKIFGYVKMVTAAFWEAYLKDDPKAKACLTEGGFERALGKDGTFEKKLK